MSVRGKGEECDRMSRTERDDSNVGEWRTRRGGMGREEWNSSRVGLLVR